MTKLDKSLFFFILIGLFICAESLRLGFGTFRSPKTGFFPFLIGLTLFVLSSLGVVANLWKADRNGFERPAIDWSRTLPLYLVYAAYSYLMTVIGFAAATLFFVFTLLKILDRKSWLFSAITAVSATLICYYVFVVQLNVQFPEGIWDF